ncbi:MAG TPA: cell division protein FtsZ [Bacteroidales bacterium]|nr:cell division protein FtsZ [Bacteroidales bacterium]HQF01974.1 cell division protein FtsZ [Bacteroidales bacterium]HQH15072.1 cell division protein FtsZ [Bacteroidales bacterium]HQO08276.1 cell division protein FtsZ [Bacteroidales bacterium]HQP54352.1 cell division protein FtsZ [Bacteroidales bacterium]
MNDMLLFDAPKQRASIIKVIGVGGGGSNAVTHMYKQGIKGVDFVICNTDSQAMDISAVPNKIQLGKTGLGAGSIPDVGRLSAEENIEEIKKIIESNTKMLFVTAGMGGGTGTGAAPVIAKLAKEMGILTVGIVTLPFNFEGRKRRLQAEKGIEELKKYVDTLLLISNEKLREIHGNLKISEAFGKADDILTTAAKGIAELITVAGYINVDFEDVKTVMQNSGTAIMGSASAEGNDRARIAVKEALTSPLLNDNKIVGASNILLYISSGKEEITFDEVTEITDYIQEEAGENAEIIWGNGYDDSLGDKISITLIATGFLSPEEIDENTLNRQKKKRVYNLNDDLPNKQSNEQAELETLTIVETDNKQDIECKPIEITEITLLKSESVDNKKVANPTREINLGLFENIENKIQSKSCDQSSSQQVPVRPFNDGPLKNSSLKIKHTVGDPIPFNDLSSKREELAQQKSVIDKKADDRVEKLRSLSIFGDKFADKIDEMEKVPAYMRRNVQLNPVTPSSESAITRYTLSENEDFDAEIKSNEIPFLHNKPD